MAEKKILFIVLIAILLNKTTMITLKKIFTNIGTAIIIQIGNLLTMKSPNMGLVGILTWGIRIG